MLSNLVFAAVATLAVWNAAVALAPLVACLRRRAPLAPVPREPVVGRDRAS